jgi:perosamine synthetase
MAKIKNDQIDEDLKFLKEDSIIDVFKKINRNGHGVCFYVSKVGKLLGVVTDGDIRRALIKEHSVDILACDAVCEDFVYGFIDENIQEWAEKISLKVKVLPLVDRDFKLKSFYATDKLTYIPISSPTLSQNEIANLGNAISSGWISSSGHYVVSFEEKFAKFVGAKFATTTSNGTTALHLALLALGIGPGDEVIVPDLTFAATINAVLHCGATPIIVDIDKQSWCISVDCIKKVISEKTKCIIVVHLCGQVADMDAIMSLSKQNDLYVIEDCAEAHGAKFKENTVGSIGDIGCFSFFANKIITTGEGGMCVTQNNELYDKMRLIKNHGMSEEKKYWHTVIGYNYRMTNLQAAIGLAQLESINDYLNIRNKYENLYRQILPDLGFDCEFQKDFKNRSRVTWLVSVLSKDLVQKKKLFEYFSKKNTDIRPFFYPLSEMPIYENYAPLKCVVSKEVSNMGSFLPTFNNTQFIPNIDLIRIKNEK